MIKIKSEVLICGLLFIISLVSCKSFKQLKANSNLNVICNEGVVYNMEDVDKNLLKKMQRFADEEHYTNFVLRKRIKAVGLYQLGCVSDGSFISCTHSSGTNIFIVHNIDLFLFKESADTSKVFVLLDGFVKEGVITTEEQTMFKDMIKEIVNRNVTSKKQYVL